MTNYSLPQGFVLKGKTYTYYIEEVLGQGSFGITYLASTRVKVEGALGSLETTIKVAVKEFFMQDVNGREDSMVTSGSQSGLYENYRRKFANEARNLSQLSHPNIIKVLEAFEANNTVYYAMEYCEGGSLNEIIESQNGLAESKALAYMEQIASALSFMHSKNTIHLDLKPANIMLSKRGDAILIDFGLSKHYDANGEPESSTTIGGGTPGYSPIEQANYSKGDKLEATLDIYALGATLYKMLTGERPPVASDIFNEGFDASPLHAKGVSSHTIACIEKAMASAKKQRYQTVAEFADALSLGSAAFGSKSSRTSKIEETEFQSPKNEKTELKEESPRNESRSSAKKESVSSPKATPEMSADKVTQPAKSKNRTKVKYILFGLGALLVAVIILGHTTQYGLSLIANTLGYSTLKVKYLEAAARKGDWMSMVAVGDAYFEGKYVTKDEVTALKWYTEAALHEPSGSKAELLGHDYESDRITCTLDGGQVTDKYAEAAKWYTIAGEKGNHNSALILMDRYKSGIGVPKDINKELYWTRKLLIIDQNDPDFNDKKHIDPLKERISKLEKDSMAMLSNKKVNAGKKVNAVKNEDNTNTVTTSSGREFGVVKPDYYSMGKEAYDKENYSEAFKYLKKAAEQGHAEAQYLLGKCYFNGQGVTEDRIEAGKWTRKAAEQGYVDAQYLLGECYSLGKGVTKDLTEATKWYRKAAEQGNDNAKRKLEELAVPEEDIEDDAPLIKVGKMPTFQGGDLNTFRNWVMTNLKYPHDAQENGISGRVIISFVVEKDGSVTNIKVLQSPHESLTAEAIRVVKSSPKWEPGMQSTRPVRVMYALPIEFRFAN